jgi:nickel/cobalt transporter (NicO) family protein
MDAIIQIFLSSVLLSVVHAAIPNHWLPLVAIGRVEKWNERETLSVTAITGMAHTISTIIIGIVVGLIGYKLSESYHFISHTVAPTILVMLGVFYLYQDYSHSKIHHNHEHSHINVDEIVKKNKTKRSIVTTLSIAMFFSPCIEVEVYYFTAARLGWVGIIIVSATYFFITILGMMLLVKIATQGVQKLQLHFMEHREKLISGLILIIVGLLAIFVKY